MKKILIIILLISLFINGYFLFFNSKKVLVNNKNIEKKVKNNNINSQKNKKFSLKESLKSKEEFNKFFSNINEKYNLSKILIDEFRKVKTNKDFLNYEKKFGSQLILFTSLKIKNIDLYLKYFKFYLKINLKNISYDNVKEDLINLLNNQFKKDFWDPNKDDYVQLAVSSGSLSYKENQCKKAFYNDKDNYKSCIRFVIFMLANNENNYCEKMDTNYYKKWCFDTLKLLKNEKE